MNPNAAFPVRSTASVAVIGGGVCGLTAARELARLGIETAVFDKGRGVGGRAALRRTDVGNQFDHGAQYFTVRSDAFRGEVERWIAAGVVGRWEGVVAAVACDANGCRRLPMPGPKERFVGVPGMNALGCRLRDDAVGAGATVASGVEVRELAAAADGWRLTSTGGEALGHYARVLVTCPAPQAATLLADAAELADAANSVAMAGCWATMVAFSEPVAIAFDGAFVNGSADHTPLAWVARDTSKPGRPQGGGDCWVLHGSPSWTAANLGLDREAVGRSLLAGFRRVCGGEVPSPSEQQTHRWLYALPESPLADRVLADAGRGLYAAGDWCGGPRVEGAYLSGLRAAEAIAAA